jgi:RNA polymerase sigma-70 factor (ECF subfamily)
VRLGQSARGAACPTAARRTGLFVDQLTALTTTLAVPSRAASLSIQWRQASKAVIPSFVVGSALAGVVFDHAGVRDGLNELLPRLWRFCHVLAGNRSTADDLAQSACVRALERAGQFQPGTRLDQWVFRIAQSIWFNQRRAEKVRRGLGTVPAEEAGLASTGADAEANIYLSQVLSSVMALPEAQRETVLLVYVEGFSYQEASEMLDIPIGTVMSRLAVARGRLSRLRYVDIAAGMARSA